MTAVEKHKEELQDLKSARINRILEQAFLLFAEKGIDTITMNDIAKKSEIGVASLYRYFATKDEIAIQVAIWIWEKQKELFMPFVTDKKFESRSGLSQLKNICLMFTNIYETQENFLRFIYFFDSYIVRQKIEQSRLAEYEAIIQSVQKIVADAIHKGIADKSIKPAYKKNENELYFTLMHTLFSMAQKLSLSKQMLAMDKIVDGKTQLNMTSELLISSLENKP